MIWYIISHHITTYHFISYYYVILCSMVYAMLYDMLCYVMLWMSLVTGLFFLVLLLKQWRSPPIGLQASHCSTFRVMCFVPGIAVFCSESIECFPSTTSKFFLKLLDTIPVAPFITGIIVHFRFHIRCISIHELLYFNLFSASFCTTVLSAGTATSISVHVFSFLFFVYYEGVLRTPQPDLLPNVVGRNR